MDNYYAPSSGQHASVQYAAATPLPPPKSVEQNTSTEAPTIPPRVSSQQAWSQPSRQQSADWQRNPARHGRPSYQSPPPQDHHQHHQAPAPTQTSPYQQQQEHSPLPQILQDKSKADLETVLRDPALLQALLHAPATTHRALADSESHLNQLLETNIQLARNVDATYTALQAQRAATSSKLISVRALEQQWKRKQAELERRLEPWGPRELHQRLGASIVEGERMCRGVEESFLDDVDGRASDREVMDWIKRVRDGRKAVALRKERRARWDEGRVGGWR